MKSRVLGLSLAAFLAMTAAAAAADVGQNVSNFAPVVANVGTLTNGPIIGFGNSASISATGALAQVSVLNGFANVPNVSAVQLATNTGVVVNAGLSVASGSILGGGNSVSISATGAATAVSVSGVNDATATAVLGFKASSQTALNYGVVSNSGNIAVVGSLGGFANSLSISATGALTQASVTNIGGGALGVVIGGMPQVAVNVANVSNQGLIVTGGGVGGLGNSMSIAATGAAASASVASTGGSVGFAFVGANQAVLNGGNIANTGNIATASISGTGNSASVQATGALAQASITSVGGNVTNSAVSGTQSAVNTGAVVNSGTISSLAGMSGNFNSMSVSAVGAAAVASISSIR